MQELFFNTPWWLLIVLVVGGAILFWSGNNRQDKTLKLVGLSLLGLGIAMGVISYLIDTDLEAATKKTKQLIYAVEKRDWPTFESIVDERTSLAMFHNKKELVAGAKATVESIGLKSVHIIGTDFQQTASTIDVNVKIVSDQEKTNGQNVVSNWKFNWQDYGAGWRLVTITPLKSEQVTADQIQSNLRSGN